VLFFLFPLTLSLVLRSVSPCHSLGRVPNNNPFSAAFLCRVLSKSGKMYDRASKDHFMLKSNSWVCQGLGLVSVEVRGEYVSEICSF